MPPRTSCHTLDNGLTVLLRPMAGVATVSTWIFYRVGVRNERPGQTGISHWVEHMAFKGTEHFGKGEIARQVNRHGGIWNGLTYLDWTAYFETLPAEHLDLALRIEADRMSNLRFDPAETEAERTVVLSEREGNENDPAYLLHEEVSAAALRVHPYRQPIIGWKEDLQRLTREELFQHYRATYTPNNAILVLAGAIEPEAVLEAVSARFSSPAAPPTPPPQLVEPPQQSERRVVLRRPGPTPIIELAFPAPRAGDPDYVPFLVLDAILSGAKGLTLFAGSTSTYRSARLYRALVETERAVSVRSLVRFTLDPGLFTVRAILRAGRAPEEVEPPLLAELERLSAEPPDPQELARTVRQLRAQLAYGSESTTAQGYWLGSLAIVDRPERLDSLLDEVGAVRPQDVQRVAAHYLGPEKRTIGWFVPRDPHPTTLPREMAGDEVLRDGGARSPLPAEEIIRSPLPGGTVLLVREKRTHPVVAVQGTIRAGSLFDPPGKEGLAQLTAQMLLRGTERRSFRQIHETLEGVGAGIEFSAGLHAVTFAGKSLAEDLPIFLELLVDLLRRPAFSQTEWQRLQGEALTDLHHLEDDPVYVADRAFRELLYPPGHPHHRRTEGTGDSVAAIEAADLAAFHRRHFHPAALVIAVAGDVSAAEVEARLADLLAGWDVPLPPEEPTVPPAPRPPEVRWATRLIPGKSQTWLVLGVPGPARADPDYYAALMANAVLGQLGLMGRLGASVRDAQGLAYSVYSTLEAGVSAGPWSVRAGVAPQNVQRAATAIVEEIGRFLETGPTEEERADTLAYLTGQLPLSLETNDGVAATLLIMERFGLGLDHVERYPAILERITAEEIRGVARHYLSTTGYVLGAAGPPGSWAKAV